jgi:hypothetical protein
VAVHSKSFAQFFQNCAVQGEKQIGTLFWKKIKVFIVTPQLIFSLRSFIEAVQNDDRNIFYELTFSPDPARPAH